MDLSTATLWWVGAGLMVIVEIASGTFYLLMIAIGFSAAALAAHAGLPVAMQIVAAALVGGGATAVLHWRRAGQAPAAPARENRDVNLDIGERVNVPAWAADLTARVDYRGSMWSARLEPGAARVAGSHRVCAVEGNWLVLRPETNADGA